MIPGNQEMSGNFFHNLSRHPNFAEEFLFTYIWVYIWEIYSQNFFFDETFFLPFYFENNRHVFFFQYDT